MDEYILAFQHLELGLHTRADLQAILNENNLRGNITALTYNRWNRGMQIIDFNRLMFEYLNRNQYRYLGPNYNYNGPVYIYGHHINPQGIIGNWENGVFNFAIEGINNFVEWIDGGYQYLPLENI